MSDDLRGKKDKKPSFVPTLGNLKDVEKSFKKAREGIKKKRDFKKEDFKSV